MDEYAALHLLSLVLVPFFLYLFSSFLPCLSYNAHTPYAFTAFRFSSSFLVNTRTNLRFLLYEHTSTRGASSYRTFSSATSNEKKEKKLKRSWLVLLEDLEAVGYSFEFIEGTLRYGLGGLMKI